MLESIRDALVAIPERRGLRAGCWSVVAAIMAINGGTGPVAKDELAQVVGMARHALAERLAQLQTVGVIVQRRGWVEMSLQGPQRNVASSDISKGRNGSSGDITREMSLQGPLPRARVEKDSSSPASTTTLPPVVPPRIFDDEELHYTEKLAGILTDYGGDLERAGYGAHQGHRTAGRWIQDPKAAAVYIMGRVPGRLPWHERYRIANGAVVDLTAKWIDDPELRKRYKGHFFQALLAFITTAARSETEPRQEKHPGIRRDKPAGQGEVYFAPKRRQA